VATDVSDCRNPPQRSAIEGRDIFLAILRIKAGRGRGKLVMDEDLAEDLWWDAAAPRECIMAASDHAEWSGVDGGHLFV